MSMSFVENNNKENKVSFPGNLWKEAKSPHALKVGFLEPKRKHLSQNVHY